MSGVARDPLRSTLPRQPTSEALIPATSSPDDLLESLEKMADRMTKAQRSATMARVRTKNTAPEMALRKALWAAGLRGWRCHSNTVPGRPDVAWIGRRVAVFCDGAFWHGHPDYYWNQSGPFWDAKIARNRARDERVNADLADAGWRVVRIWDFEVETNLAGCVARIRAALDA